MASVSLSVIAERGQNQLEGTISAARNVLSHFATDLNSKEQGIANAQQVGQSTEFNNHTFLAAKDMYLVCSGGLRETVREIGARRKALEDASQSGTVFLADAHCFSFLIIPTCNILPLF
jgi:hypothetical protein